VKVYRFRDIRTTFALVLLLVASTLTLHAQSPFATSDSPDSVFGYPGSIEIRQNLLRLETSVVFTPTVTLGETSSRIMFILQHVPGEPLPPEWSGQGKVLASYGAMAILGDDGTKRVFKFPGRPMPPSLETVIAGERVYPVFGIARHGETQPLTTQQIQSLREAGSCKIDTGSTAVRSSSTGRMSIPSCEGMQCSSGGAGSSSCASGLPFNCSVSCNSPYSACCIAALGRCMCCTQ